MSTKTLSFMEFVAGLGRREAQIVAFAHSGDGAVPGSIVATAAPHDFLEVSGQKGADRGIFRCRQDAHFAKKISIQLSRDVRFLPGCVFFGLHGRLTAGLTGQHQFTR